MRFFLLVSFYLVSQVGHAQDRFCEQYVLAPNIQKVVDFLDQMSEEKHELCGVEFSVERQDYCDPERKTQGLTYFLKFDSLNGFSNGEIIQFVRSSRRPQGELISSCGSLPKRCKILKHSVTATEKTFTFKKDEHHTRGFFGRYRDKVKRRLSIELNEENHIKKINYKRKKNRKTKINFNCE